MFEYFVVIFVFMTFFACDAEDSAMGYYQTTTKLSYSLKKYIFIVIKISKKAINYH